MNQEKQKVKIYSAEFRESSVKLAIGSDKPITQTAKDLGVNANTLHTWINKYSQPKECSKTARTEEHLYDELKRLKKEVARLIEERDLLLVPFRVKKAAAYLCPLGYFAKEQRSTAGMQEVGQRHHKGGLGTEQLPRSTPGLNTMRANFRLNRCVGS